MNKLTKSELIDQYKTLLEQSKVCHKVIYDRYLLLMHDTEIIPDPVPEVDERERIIKKYPVDSWVKQVNNGAIYQVDYYAKELVNLKDEDSLSTILISELELNFEPYELDTELEEAKKLVGTWVKFKSLNQAFKVTNVHREPKCNNVIVVSNGDELTPRLKSVEPFPLPTAAPKWRCMKTDVENTLMTRLVCLNDTYHTGFYDIAKETWCIDNQYIDLSCYYSHLWLEIPRGE